MATETKTAKNIQPYHHGDLRQALLDAAFASIEANGHESISLAALAKSLGVSQAAPYRHFPDRNALLAAVALGSFREFTEHLRNAADKGKKGTRLSRMAHAYVAFGTARPGIYRLMFASPVLTQAADDDELKITANQSFTLLVDAIEGEANPAKRKRKATHIWVALHGVVMLVSQNLLSGRAGDKEQLDLVEAIIAI
ncbi:MAG: TetR/AcrR family transcriptional regulator [Pseudomonadota bacterium]